MKKTIFVDHTSRIGGAQLSLFDIALYLKENSSVLLFGDGEFYKMLQDKNVDVKLYDLEKILYPLKRDVSILKVCKSAFSLALRLFTIRKLLKQYDIVYTNSFKSYVISSLSLLGIKRKVILHLRDALTKDNFSPIVIKTVINFTKIFHTNVIANSSYTKECFVSSGGNSKQCTVILNAVNSNEFLDISEIDFHGEYLNILSLGRISPWKGQHIVIEAIKDLEFVKLRIVGSANFGEDDYFNYLKKLVSDYNLQHRVEFCPFSLDIKDHLSWCSVFIHSSTSPEPVGRDVDEGMLAGRVVIATDSGGVPEIINNESYGILVPPGDITRLNKAINDIYLDKDKYKIVANKGKEKAIKDFSLPVLYTNITSYLNNLK
ncbi:glycosyltransferase family 4 protein [Klebsiella pneumoniae]|uniref:glycosyltransferase family 4 protein n=1 Tax=Klebsiella pneumoniae TaxID=573 RepID=UPI0025AABE61|nr:glycosyltransferase family 4 protein [Klebsiella pneumoniae]MDM9508306.1 glycosyltransferase family 4 protein [Klebsiella pneumoniae]